MGAGPSGPDENKGQPGLFSAALSGLCPHCGAPSLFAAPAAIAERCGACGLEFLPLERGSRWAGVFTMLLALVLTGLALGIDALIAPPLWLQLAFWAPVTVGGVIFSLRLFKTWLLYAAYERTKA
ncbi:MAG: DUF983 domain-containing protein [Erythrobacter sp.]